MDLSLVHLKKVLKFGILLVGIPFVDLKNGFGAYSPSSLKDKYFTLFAYGNGILYWPKTTMTQNYGSEALVKQSITPSAMVDSNGDTYVLKNVGFNQDGAAFCILKFYKQKTSSNLAKWFYPWHLVNNSINCQETPNLSVFPNVDPTHFKNYIHNAFQPCIAQEVGKYSDYLYVFFYVPPTRYMNPSNGKNDEGILMLKIRKSDLSVDNKKFYSGADNEVFKFDHQRPRRDSDSYAFGAECGNYQAWVDTDDSGTDHVLLSWIALEEANNFSKSRAYQLYNDSVTMISDLLQGYAGGRGLESRAIKYNNENVFTGHVDKGRFLLYQYLPNELKYKNMLSWSNYASTPFGYMDHLAEACNAHTARRYDFCIVDNKYPAKVGG